MPRARLLVAFAGFILGASPARAACYEDVGCTHTHRYRAEDLMRLADCTILWEMRNGIYHEKGYCFRTQRGIDTFGNAGCRYDDPAAVPLNDYERANIATVQQVERRKDCPR
jgi:hypothetical protein